MNTALQINSQIKQTHGSFILNFYFKTSNNSWSRDDVPQMHFLGGRTRYNNPDLEISEPCSIGWN